MRIFEAIKFHYKKNLLNYGILSAVLTIGGCVFVPKAVRWFYQILNHSYGWTVVLAFVYALIITVVAIPMINAVMWIFDKKF